MKLPEVNMAAINLDSCFVKECQDSQWICEFSEGVEGVLFYGLQKMDLVGHFAAPISLNKPMVQLFESCRGKVR